VEVKKEILSVGVKTGSETDVGEEAKDKYEIVHIL